MTWLLRECLKCGGDLYWHNGEGFNCYKCFQCGYVPNHAINESDRIPERKVHEYARPRSKEISIKGEGE